MSKNKKAPAIPQNSVTYQEVHHGVGVYAGPVPPPGIMEEMEKILPGAADRMFTMAEKEQNAKIEHLKQNDENNARIVKNGHTENMTALCMAFVVSLSFCVCGTILVLHGHTKIGALMLGTTVLGIVSSFLGRMKKNVQK